MDFGRVKTILIVLFVFVNLFLIYNLINLSSDSKTLDKASIETTISLLEKQQISIDKSLIPTRMEYMDYLNLSNPLTTPDELAYRLLGPAEKQNESFVSEKGTLLISNGLFLWEPKAESISFRHPLPSSQTASSVLDFLKRNGFPVKDFKWAGTLDNGNGNFEVSFQEIFQNQEIFDVKLTVSITKDTIESVHGKWFDIESIKNTGQELKSPLTVLMEFSSTVTEKTIITDFTPGYYTDTSSQNYKNLPGIPCWKITLKSGSVLYYDAVTAEPVRLEGE